MAHTYDLQGKTDLHTMTSQWPPNDLPMTSQWLPNDLLFFFEETDISHLKLKRSSIYMFSFKKQKTPEMLQNIGGHWEVIGRSLGGHWEVIGRSLCRGQFYLTYRTWLLCLWSKGQTDTDRHRQTDERTVWLGMWNSESTFVYVHRCSFFCGYASGYELQNLRFYIFSRVLFVVVVLLEVKFGINASIFSALFLVLLLRHWMWSSESKTKWQQKDNANSGRPTQSKTN